MQFTKAWFGEQTLLSGSSANNCPVATVRLLSKFSSVTRLFAKSLHGKTVTCFEAKVTSGINDEKCRCLDTLGKKQTKYACDNRAWR